MGYVIIAILCLLYKLCTHEGLRDKIAKNDANPYDSIKSNKWIKEHGKL